MDQAWTWAARGIPGTKATNGIGVIIAHVLVHGVVRESEGREQPT